MESLERKEEAGESMNEFVDRYINLYLDKSITKCVANAIQTSRLFLGVNDKARSCLLADAVQNW